MPCVAALARSYSMDLDGEAQQCTRASFQETHSKRTEKDAIPHTSSSPSIHIRLLAWRIRPEDSRRKFGPEVDHAPGEGC